jgi:hypothetical protein
MKGGEARQDGKGRTWKEEREGRIENKGWRRKDVEGREEGSIL